MSLTKEEVSKIARLSRIRLSDEEQIIMQNELNNILHWIEQLQQVNTDATPIFSDLMTHAMPEREDVVTDGNKKELLMANATDHNHGMFAVPKVVE